MKGCKDYDRWFCKLLSLLTSPTFAIKFSREFVGEDYLCCVRGLFSLGVRTIHAKGADYAHYAWEPCTLMGLMM